MQRFLSTSLMALALMAGLTSQPLAQGLVERATDALAVVPTTSANRYDIHLAWSVGLGGPTSIPLDLSTELLLYVNGVERDSLSVPILADGGSGLCGTGNCGAGCGGGYIDGVFNTLLCLAEGSTGCGCQFPSILSTFPGEPLQPGDEIMVLLRPSPGAVPDSSGTVDVEIVSLGATPIAWNRTISDVTLQPTAGAPDSFFDVFIEVDFGSSGMTGALDLSPQAEVLVNGVSMGTFDPPCGPWYATPGSACPLCDGSICGTITCNGQTVTEMRCMPDDDLGCGCVSTSACLISVPGLVLQPGDDVDVILKPVPGALPELPGFEDDEQNVGRWLDLGHALAGTHGDPVTLGLGTLIGGDPVSMTLGNALENTTAYLVIGIADLSLPFKGGVLVPDPSPPGLYVPLPTGAAGTIGLAGVWPLGFPSGFVSYYQWWIVDAVGPKGFSASNALSATTP
jgi:hypothetical protein